MVRATYILRYIYSLKSYVVNLQCKWVLANQSSGRCFSHVKIKKQKQKQTKNDTSNQNRVRLFFTRERNDAFDKKPQRCVSFAPKFPPFIGACGLQRLCFEVTTSQIFKEKRFSPRFLLLGNWGASRKLEWIVSYISLSMNSGKGKKQNET